MIVAINYADENFKKAQQFNTKTAYSKGRVDKVIQYSPKDIDKKFYLENKYILDKPRGGGYWLWKPYIILKTMKEMSKGDYLFYCDSGAAYINDIRYLIKDLEKSGQDIMAFELPLLENQWTKNKTFELRNCNSTGFRKSNQILATYIFIKVSDYSIQFINQYLNMCKNRSILIDDKCEQSEDFIQHRHDQSIFSLLCKKNSIKPFRDPSQYGIRPWEYLANGRVYNPKNYINSSYPQIIVSFRTEDGKKYVVKDRIKYFMTKIGLLNKNQFIKKNKIK